MTTIAQTATKAKRPPADDVSKFTERPRPERKIYGEDEITPLDRLLADQPAPSSDTDADPAAEAQRLQAVVHRIEADIETAENRLDELEASRASVVLNGGDLDQLHKSLRDAEQLIETLEAGLVEARSMLSTARANASRVNLEQHTAEVKAEHLEPAADALLALYNLMSGIHYAAVELEKHKQAIEGQKLLAKQQGRPDLALDFRQLHAAVVDSIGVLDAKADLPVRNGESDAQFEARLLTAVATEAKHMTAVLANSKPKPGFNPYSRSLLACLKAHVEQQEGEDDEAYTARLWAALAEGLNVHSTDAETATEHHERVREALARLLKIDRRGESDAAYNLRIANARASQASLVASSDPLREIAEKALAGIRKYALGLDQHALNRQRPEMQRLKPVPGDTAESWRVKRP